MIISQTTYAELQKLDVGSWRVPNGLERKFPLSTKFYRLYQLGENFSWKKSGEEIIPHLVKVLIHSNISQDQIVILCFDPNILVGMKRHLPTIETCWLTGFQKEGELWLRLPSIDEILKTLGDIKADDLDCNAHPCIDEKFTQSLSVMDLVFTFGP